MQFWNEWTEKSPQLQDLSADPKQSFPSPDSFKSSNSIVSHLNEEEESSAVTRQKNRVLIEVDDKPFNKISTINSATLHQAENCSAATIPLTVCDSSLTDSSEDVTELGIQEGSEENDGASVKSDSSTSSAGSVWVMEDMIKSTAAIQDPVPPNDDPRHHHGTVIYFFLINVDKQIKLFSLRPID